MIELGDKVKDVVTGFTGIATGKASYLTGCDQYCLTPQCDEKNSKLEPVWFDQNRLSVVEEKVVQIQGTAKLVKEAGGPQFTPPAK